ncbi:PHB depolymerase family esterase, partial [Pseudorhodoplanes sp.]|uniref:extracellular catalytic domain type 1 short-chain-length polyhydroxyalkanoate depolymerase n=1 Tax=Pseudorhodoplanes sp. TaxID=1934341 RepID=UPI002C41CC6F
LQTHLTEIRSFGSNPGALRMFAHVPRQTSEQRALVVVLHGCTQSAAAYDLGAGWSTLADRFGFCLLLPEQQVSNNPNRCFNWFQPDDSTRGSGEAQSIRQMIDKMMSDHDIDPKRVFVTGLSAGGAMASVMLATYPDVFAGGAIVAGLPYGAANNVQQAFQTMFQSPPRPARAWGDVVRGASPHRGPWPRISVWHGGVDATVIPSNAAEIIKQWTDVHGLPLAPSSKAIVDGYPRRVWLNAAGEEIIESYTITNMAHGTPLATGDADHECGAAGPFLLEVGISSSYHIAKFFGLATASAPSHASAQYDQYESTVPAGRLQDERLEATRPETHVLEGEVLGPESDGWPERRQHPHTRFDVGAVINNALKAAGLMK